jgi:hypothetical protein
MAFSDDDDEDAPGGLIVTGAEIVQVPSPALSIAAARTEGSITCEINAAASSSVATTTAVEATAILLSMLDEAFTRTACSVTFNASAVASTNDV